MARPLGMSVKLALVALALNAVEPTPPPAGSAGGPREIPDSRPMPPALPPLHDRANATMDTLRLLLALTPEERAAWLAKRSPAQQALLRRELATLENLTPAARERRLRLLAMRVVMDPLLELAPEARQAAIASLPPSQRTFVEQQLRAWDALPAAQRAERLAAHGGWLPLPTTPGLPTEPPLRAEPPPPPSPEFRSRLEDDLHRWSALDERAQTNATRALLRLLDLSPRDQQAVLARLAPVRRQPVERLLSAFGPLDREARARSVEAYWRFAAMGADERARFWQNAERWSALSPDERRAWRTLTAHLPPLPPGLGPTPDLPPALPAKPSLPPRTNAQVGR
jgi:hypothetical protein